MSLAPGFSYSLFVFFLLPELLSPNMPYLSAFSVSPLPECSQASLMSQPQAHPFHPILTPLPPRVSKPFLHLMFQVHLTTGCCLKTLLWIFCVWFWIRVPFSFFSPISLIVENNEPKLYSIFGRIITYVCLYEYESHKLLVIPRGGHEVSSAIGLTYCLVQKWLKLSKSVYFHLFSEVGFKWMVFVSAWTRTLL